MKCLEEKFLMGWIMKNVAIALVLVLLFGSVSFAALENLITNGDFSSPGITDVGSSWVLSSSNLNEWYGYSSKGNDFYAVTPEGHVTAALKDQSGRLLLQVIAAPEAGDYTFTFDYQLTDDSDMYSVVRVFAVDDDADFSLKTTDWSGSFSGVTSAKSVYDQGGHSSYLPTATNWTSVKSSVNVGAGTDYLVIYAAFSHDGSTSSLKKEFANLDNFSLTSTSVGSQSVPEPATVAVLGLGGFFLTKTKRN